MANSLSYVRSFALMLLVAVFTLSDCYDPMDPYGNITVTFDIYQYRTDGYQAKVTIQNYYQYRHIDKPGWSLGWTWSKKEVIWSMRGAFATHQGNCSLFKYDKPHSCERSPVIVDLWPEATPENRSEDCCRSGVLNAWTINPSISFSSFEIAVGNLEPNSPGYIPQNLTLTAPGPGYTCGPLMDVDPTVSLDIGGRRQAQVYRTWKTTCTYSSFLANKTPICCVSLSTFYNPKVTSCPKCSCGCRETDKPVSSCIREGYPSSSSDFVSNFDTVRCTDHMCPIQVHWHVKNNYMDHWRVKLTVSNYNYKRNYPDWNVLVQHPGFSQSLTTYSFNTAVLPAVGLGDNVALFWGIENYNKELLNADKDELGSVTTEILLQKDSDAFTLRNGWALPRRIYFNGENCEMPLPDTFPMLPNADLRKKPSHFSLLFIIFTSLRLVTWI